MSVIPIRPDLPIGITSEAILFCADAIADFIATNDTDPSGVIMFLFDGTAPTVHATGVTRGDIALASIWAANYALEGPGE